MKNHTHLQFLHYPWNKFVLYIFDELEGDEMQSIENIIVENDEYTFAVAQMTDFFSEKDIYDSSDFQRYFGF